MARGSPGMKRTFEEGRGGECERVCVSGTGRGRISALQRLPRAGSNGRTRGLPPTPSAAPIHPLPLTRLQAPASAPRAARRRPTLAGTCLCRLQGPWQTAEVKQKWVEQSRGACRTGMWACGHGLGHEGHGARARQHAALPLWLHCVAARTGDNLVVRRIICQRKNHLVVAPGGRVHRSEVAHLRESRQARRGQAG